MKNKTIEYLKNKINDSWYYNAKLDYDIDGEFLSATYDESEDKIIIYFREDNKKYMAILLYVSDYTNEQLYDIWHDPCCTDWEEVA